jgi:antitoxin component of MazEF toxin-antitoxin module
MKTKELKVTRIGNSRGVRLPIESLRRYRIGESVLMEERSEGILLRPAGPVQEKLSWEETAQAMAHSQEDWSEWDATLSDGLDSLPWDGDHAAELGASYEAAPVKRKKK